MIAVVYLRLLIIAGYLFKWKTGDGKQGDIRKLCSIFKVNMFIPYIHHPDRHLASGNWLKLPLADFKNALLIIAQMATEISRHVYPIFWLLKCGLNCLISTIRTSDPYIELGILSYLSLVIQHCLLSFMHMGCMNISPEGMRTEIMNRAKETSS